MIRFLVLAMMLLSTAAFAAVPKDLQTSLQQQFVQMKQQAGGRVTTDGDLNVEGDTITYPVMNILVADMKSSWSVPPIVLTFTGAAKDGKMPFTLKLPSTFKQTLPTGQVLRAVSVADQNITGEWSVKENTIARLDGHVGSINCIDAVFNTTATVNDISLQALSTFLPTDKVNILLHMQSKQVTRMPDSFISTLLPQQASVIGKIKSLPKALVVFGALVPLPGLQATLAQMGTQVDIDELNVVTTNGATLKGDGWFKAAKAESQLPVSGRMNLEWKNLQQVLTSLQQGFSAGGGDRAQTAQSMVLLMMLQGMGKSVGQDTRYTVDLTPEGQVILNGQDVTAMFVGDKSLLRFFQPKQAQPSSPAVPVTPVKDEGAL